MGEIALDIIPVDQLSLVTSNEPVPTVEADIGSFPGGNFDFDDALAKGLSSIVKLNLKARFTIYYFYSNSINFNEPTDSVFIALAGPEKYLREIHAILDKITGVRIRFSDTISPYRGRPMIHVEKGRLYRYEDEAFWYLSTGLSKQSESSSLDPVRRKDGEDGELIEHAEQGRGSIASRFRRARGDASVASIKRTIERVFGLPEGSVKLCGPDGTPLKANAKIATLRKRWD